MPLLEFVIEVVSIVEKLESCGNRHEASEQHGAFISKMEDGRPHLDQRMQVHLKGKNTRQEVVVTAESTLFKVVFLYLCFVRF